MKSRSKSNSIESETFVWLNEKKLTSSPYTFSVNAAICLWDLDLETLMKINLERDICPDCTAFLWFIARMEEWISPSFFVITDNLRKKEI